MKQILILFSTFLSASFAFSQATQTKSYTYINKNWSYGKAYRAPNNKPKNWKPKKDTLTRITFQKGGTKPFLYNDSLRNRYKTKKSPTLSTQ